MKTVCPYCRGDMAPAEVHSCPVCQTPHHKECWDDNQGCTVWGCASGPADEKNPNPPPPDPHNPCSYFINHNGQQCGPYTTDEISHYLTQGLLLHDDTAWAEGMPAWIPVAKLLQDKNNTTDKKLQIPTENIYCRSCGTKNAFNDYKCVHCGTLLHSTNTLPEVVNGGLFSSFIPYKNRQALLAYYFGLFSLIPVLGAPLAIAALIFGSRGINYFKQHPEAGGKGRAYAGIILGVVCCLYYILVFIHEVNRA